MWMSHGTHIIESWRIRHGTYMNESWHAYEWVVVHVRIDSGTYLNEWAMANSCIFHGTQTDDSWHTYPIKSSLRHDTSASKTTIREPASFSLVSERSHFARHCSVSKRICVLQCVAIYCIELQCVAVVLQWCCSGVAVALQYVAVLCSVLQSVAVWCSVLQCVAVWSSV